MRIIAGKFGGRRFAPPSKMPHTRPTTDLAKGGLFNTLQNLLPIEEAKTLDLFGGTGSITYELASRGATDMTIVEQDHHMANFIKATTQALGIATQVQLVKQEVFRFMERCTEAYQFIFAGPPYALAEIDMLPELVFEKKLLLPDGIFVLEHTPRNNYDAHEHFLKKKAYGTTHFSFFR